MPNAPVRPRGDPQQYDDLADEWWKPHGAFAMLHWLAAARASLIPAADRPGAVLLDVGCGGGLLAPHVAGKGYRHFGVDLSPTATRIARDRGVTTARGDCTRLPFRDGAADVVAAGEILEHVADVEGTVAECCRVLRPGGTLVVDTIADTALAGFLAITVAERIPGGAPPRLHDRRLFVNRRRLVSACLRHGVRLRLTGLRPPVAETLAWALHRRDTVRMVATRPTSVLFQGVGRKEAG